mgnify:FL=1
MSTKLDWESQGLYECLQCGLLQNTKMAQDILHEVCNNCFDLVESGEPEYDAYKEYRDRELAAMRQVGEI